MEGTVVVEKRASPDKIYVALGRSFKENEKNLREVLRLFADKEIVILHIHRPLDLITCALEGVIPFPSLERGELNKFKQKERVEMHKTMEMYWDVCTTEKVKAEQLIVESKNVAVSIVELVAKYNISKLVIGAASNDNYMEEMRIPTSSKALYVCSHALSSCQIWFLCNGHVICTRESSAIQDNSSSTVPYVNRIQGERENGQNLYEFYFQERKDCHNIADIHEVQMQIIELLTERNLLRLQVDEVSADRDLLETQATEISDSKSLLQTQVDEMLIERSMLQTENSSLQRQVTRLSRKEAALHEHIKRIMVENEKLRGRLAELPKEESSPCSKKEIPSFTGFPLTELEAATCGFSKKIGEGGFGSVYVGRLRHTPVAVKQLNPESRQGLAEFQQEVHILSTVRHPNLITLIGACSEAPYLIYEYLANGSLSDRLFGDNKSQPLWWKDRLRIAAEVCLGLLFLHSNSIVHGDLKPANILLDDNLRAKISDFGICRLLPQPQRDSAETVCRLTDPKGTFEYMDPQFMTAGELTFKSDIYAFGAILLQLLSRKPVLGLVKKFEDAFTNLTLFKLLDQDAGSWHADEAARLAKLAVQCCESNRKFRPDLELEVFPVLEQYL